MIILLILLLLPYLILAIVNQWPETYTGPILIHSIEYIDRVEIVELIKYVEKEVPVEEIKKEIPLTPIVAELEESNKLRSYYDIIEFVKHLPGSAPFDVNSRDAYRELQLDKVMYAKDVQYIFDKYKMGWSDKKKAIISILQTKSILEKEKQ